MRDGVVSDDLLKHYLRAAMPREIIARMLRNLEEVYTSHPDAERLMHVKQRLAVLLPSVQD
jgi:regulator of sirC expression with transglutaminase-like and TPR domain